MIIEITEEEAAAFEIYDTALIRSKRLPSSNAVGKTFFVSYKGKTQKVKISGHQMIDGENGHLIAPKVDLLQ